MNKNAHFLTGRNGIIEINCGAISKKAVVDLLNARKTCRLECPVIDFYVFGAVKGSDIWPECATKSLWK